MPPSTLIAPLAAETAFPHLLKQWRQRRRLSQLDLALNSGVSQRHVSFLESGRANPSRSMILQLSETLDVPLRDRNAWLTAAGFAPVFKTRPLDDPQMQQVMSAIEMILANHEPFPAMALDRAWNIRLTNGSCDRLFGMLGDDIWQRIDASQPNLMRLFFHPEGIRPLIINWADIGPLIWRRALREAEALGGEEMQQVLADLSAYVDANALWSPPETSLLPVVPFEIDLNGIHLSMFAVIATFGTAQDVTADELRIETMFPADAETNALFRALNPPSKSDRPAA